ncbi:transglutaminase domain-containing protein [Roseimaritima ulvae]|uniref:transglutaminase domain-containing protein n=1 Tax=Roseimaritima ulvae TaxID=980254 RepID=UPI000835727D|nr:transglutaminase domain-containing protein [Roseimaritima ulvae]
MADRHTNPLVDTLSGSGEGMDDPAEVPPQPAQDAVADADTAVAKFTPPAAGDALSVPWQTWDAYYIGDQHIGFAHVRATAEADGGRRYQLRDQMTLRRGATKLTHQVTQDSLEDAAGQLQSFTATLHNGPAVTRVEGTRRDDKLVIELTRGNEHTTQQLPWKSHYHGLLGVQQSLRRDPLLPGQRRRIEALLPVQYQIGEFQLQATGKVSIPMLDGDSQMLTEIRSRLQLGPAGSVDTYLWIDDAGETLKTYTPALNLTAYRTDQATATAAVSADRDLLSLASIQLQGEARLADPLDVQQVRFRLTATTPSGTAMPAELPELSAAVGQRVETVADPPSLHVLVRSGLDTEAAVAAVGPQDLAANPLIDFNDRGIAAIVKALAVNPTESPRDTVLQTVGFVHEFIQNKDFSRGFAAASEVALDPGGDCTEHAVLLAAILRSRKIPTRVVAGLTYVPTASGAEMMYHMWNVAYVDDGWLPIDATLGTIAPASRIALVTSDLSSGNEYECLNPILGVMGRLEIEVLTD